jgi:transposase InsO family protein
MPWKETEKMQEKKEFVLKAMDPRMVFTELCREYGISTRVGYKWKNRFLEKGYAGLEEESRRPISNGQAMPEAVSVEILSIKNKHMAWGAKKILNIYQRNNPGKPSPARSTVEHLFSRAGLVKHRKRRRAQDIQRIQQRVVPVKPNEVWTVDFKGWWYTTHKERVDPLTVRDEYTKYIIGIDVAEKGDTAHVKAIFERLFAEYGLPEYIRSDNGPPFASVQNLWGLSKLSVWWMSLGIKLDRDDPGHPEQNGGHERMHRDMMVELEGQIDGNLNEHQKVFEKWRKEFNEERPHESLGMKRPAELYKKSEKNYEGERVDIEYGCGMKSRAVNDRGFFNYCGTRIFVGNPFDGYHIGIKEQAGKRPEVWFDNFRLGEISFETRLVENEKIIMQARAG